MVIHDIALSQLIALNAYYALGQGMEPKNGAYEEWEFDRELSGIKKRANRPASL